MKLDEPCLAVLEISDYEPSSGQREGTFLFCETPNGKFYKVSVSNEWLKNKWNYKELKSGLPVWTLHLIPWSMKKQER
jgi:hypothetical protein